MCIRDRALRALPAIALRPGGAEPPALAEPERSDALRAPELGGSFHSLRSGSGCGSGGRTLAAFTLVALRRPGFLRHSF
eukprot:6657039-Alexandrium_andersonii.AAC.1